MTMQEAIDRIAALKPHQFTDTQLVQWLSDLDRKVWHELIRLLENTAIAEEYDEDGNPITDMPEPGPYEMVEGVTPDVTLIVPEPYSELYLHYLAAQIDYWNGEIGRYNNAMAQYNATYDSFAAAITRTHIPKRNNYVSI
ncbi:MAG: hypothetical protein ACOYU3_07335 [Bacillota bacterium]